MSLKNMHKIEQPREKLEKYGPEKLSLTELLAIILRTGPKGSGVMLLAQKILREFKESKLPQASLKDLKNIKGLGSAKASEIVAVFELGRRLLLNKQVILILSPREVWEQLKDIRSQKKENFIIFFLDTQNQEIKREVISIGILNASLIHPREVFEPAVKGLLPNVILVKNS